MQCVFSITLEEIANREFWQVEKFVYLEDLNSIILAKPSKKIEDNTLVIGINLANHHTHSVLQPDALEINTKKKIIIRTSFTDYESSKIKFELEDFTQKGNELKFKDNRNPLTFQWLDKKMGLLQMMEDSTLNSPTRWIDIKYLLDNNLPIPPIIVYDMSGL